MPSWHRRLGRLLALAGPESRPGAAPRSLTARPGGGEFRPRGLQSLHRVTASVRKPLPGSPALQV